MREQPALLSGSQVPPKQEEAPASLPQDAVSFWKCEHETSLDSIRSCLGFSLLQTKRMVRALSGVLKDSETPSKSKDRAVRFRTASVSKALLPDQHCGNRASLRPT